MIVVYVAVKTKADAAGTFERILSEIQADVRQMPGCVRNEWYPDPASPRRYVSYGEFDTLEHFEAYLRSPAVERIGAELLPLLEGPPDFRHYNAALIDGS